VVSGDVIEFIIKDNQFVTFEISWFPEPEKWFLFFLPKDNPIDIGNNDILTLRISSVPPEKGQREFVITGQFVSLSEFRGTMKMPKGFFWVKYGYDNDTSFDFTVVRKD
jgi:hypothetical protein